MGCSHHLGYVKVTYAALTIQEFPAQALLRLRPALAAEPLAVIHGDHPWEAVCSHNQSAFQLGLRTSMSRAEAESFSIPLLRRSPVEEQAAKAALLHHLDTVTPRIEEQSGPADCTWLLDLNGTERLFGPPQELAARIRKDVRALGFQCQIAVSSNFHAALCLSRSMPPGKSIRLIPLGSEQQALAPLPVTALEMTEEHAEILAAWGIATLADLAQLPADDLVARLGQPGRRLRQLARGEHPHLFVSIKVPFTLEEHLEFEHPVELLDSLLFAVNPMLAQLVLRAQGRSLALESIHLKLGLDNAIDKSVIHERRIKPSLPTTDRHLLLKLLHLALAANPPPAAVTSVSLYAEPAPVPRSQAGLFSPATPEPLGLDVTLARIGAMVGPEHVGKACLKDTHQPGSFTMQKFVLTAPSINPAPRPQPQLARRMLRPPTELTVLLNGRRPTSFFFNQRRYQVEQVFGPWHLSGDWWTAQPWSTERWDVIAGHTDSRLVCVLAQNLHSRQWFLEALYD